MKDFFEGLNALGKPKRRAIIEKDFYLHKLLYQISQDDYLKDNLVFKGGTCQENNKVGQIGSSVFRQEQYTSISRREVGLTNDNEIIIKWARPDSREPHIFYFQHESSFEPATIWFLKTNFFLPKQKDRLYEPDAPPD